MKKLTSLISLILIFLNNFVTHAEGKLNIFVEYLRLCDPESNSLHKLYCTPHLINGKQYFDGNATLLTPFDDDLRSNFTVDLLVGRHYVHLISFEETRSCSSLHKYFGEFAYDIERAAQLIPGLCPIPAGRYHIHNYLPNFNLITIQNMPIGHLRLTEYLFDKKNKLIICLHAEVQNRP